MTRAFSEFLRVDEDGQLRFDGLAAADLADQFGTPLYVISEQQIHENVRAISRAFRRRYPRTEILFANKANNNPAVCAVFSQAGAGGDCFGYNELYLSLLGGVRADLLVLNGSNKQEPELSLAIEVGATISLDNLEELETVEAIARRMRTQARVQPRTRLDVVAFLDTGAYGETKAALFNAQPRPATVLVNGEHAEIITERETLQDILGRFRIPPRLLVGRHALSRADALSELAGLAAER